MVESERAESKRTKTALAISVLLMYLFYLFSNLNIYLFFSLRETWFVLAVPVMVTGTLIFCRHLWNRWEYRLAVCYCFWFLVSRMLHDNLALTEDFTKTLDVSLLLPFFALGMELTAEERRRFLDVFSSIVGGFYFIVGIACIVAFLLRTMIPNPITGQYICGMRKAEGFVRLIVFDINVDTCACWYMNSFFLMVYQFFSCRKKMWRIPILISAAVDYIVMSMIYTRSVMLAFSIMIGLLAALLIRRKLTKCKDLIRWICMILAALAIAPTAYLGFNQTMMAFGRLSVDLRYPDASPEEKQEYLLRDYTNPKKLVGDDITEVSHGRDWIYKSALVTIREKPSVLLTGTLVRDSNEIATEYLRDYGRYKEDKELPHFQNFVLQVLILTGLPGVLLALALCGLLIRSSFRLIFTCPECVSASAQVLMLPVLGGMIYGMFEITYFTNADHCSLLFYLMAGFLTATYYEMLQGRCQPAC